MNFSFKYPTTIIIFSIFAGRRILLFGASGQREGFALADMQKAAQQALKSSKILECTEMSADTVNILAASSGRTDGMLIETEDKSIKCRAVIGEVTNELCDTYSYELAEALFGGRLPE